MSLAPGLTLAGYRIARKLGAGAFGAVWLAERVDTREKVAIKTLLKQGASQSVHFDHVSRFKREATNLRRIHSDYVARCVDFIVDDEHGMLLVMEFIEGELFSDVLMDTSLSLPEAIELGVHLARGLCDMHAVGVIHRDIKPSNIMIRQLENGLQRAVIFDLGLSRLIQEPTFGDGPANGDITATASRVAIGTPAFMAPEQMLDARRATAPSDVYGVGVVLYYASSGMLPFEGDEREIARRKLSEEAPPLDVGRTDELAVRFAETVGRAIRRRPDDRFRTADAFLDALVELRELAAEVQAAKDAAPVSVYPGAMDAGPPRRFTPQPFGLSAPPPPMRPRAATVPDGTRAAAAAPKKSGGAAIAVVVAVVVVVVAAGGLWAAGILGHGP